MIRGEMKFSDAMDQILDKLDRTERILLSERSFLKSVSGVIVEMAPNRIPRNFESIIKKSRNIFRDVANNDNEFYTIRISPERVYDFVELILMGNKEFCQLNITQNELDRGVTDPEDPNRGKYKFSSLYDVETSESWRDDFIDLDACIRNITNDILQDVDNFKDCFGCINKGLACVDCSHRENLKDNFKESRKPRGKHTLACEYDCFKNYYICCHECNHSCEHRCIKDCDECGRLIKDSEELLGTKGTTVIDEVIDIIATAVGKGSCSNDSDCAPAMSDKTRLLTKIAQSTPGRNKMGCDESWYSPDYAIQNSFTREEIAGMSDKEVENLFKLARSIQEALY